MVRKSLVSLLVVAALLVMVASVSAEGNDTDGCYVNALNSVNEGVQFTVTVQCDNIPTTNNVFGFQVGTSVGGTDYVEPLPGGYTPGEFTSSAVNGVNGVVAPLNSLEEYAVTRKLTDTVAAEDFSLGTYDLKPVTTLTTADGSIPITFVDSAFKLSDRDGFLLANWIRTVNDKTVTVNDIDLAWLNGNVVVQSDTHAMTKISNVSLMLGNNLVQGAKEYTDESEGSYQATLLMDSSYSFMKGATLATSPDSTDELDIDVTAHMYGHLACSTSAVDLGDAGAAEAASSFIGTSGTITLKAGDANNDGVIDSEDSTIIGDDFDKDAEHANALYQTNINQDNIIDILDLVHVGRNYNAATAPCA